MKRESEYCIGEIYVYPGPPVLPFLKEEITVIVLPLKLPCPMGATGAPTLLDHVISALIAIYYILGWLLVALLTQDGRTGSMHFIHSNWGGWNSKAEMQCA